MHINVDEVQAMVFNFISTFIVNTDRGIANSIREAGTDASRNMGLTRWDTIADLRETMGHQTINFHVTDEPQTPNNIRIYHTPVSHANNDTDRVQWGFMVGNTYYAIWMFT
jgi:hypothetical protein